MAMRCPHCDYIIKEGGKMEKETKEKLRDTIDVIQDFRVKDLTDEETVGLLTTLKVVMEDIFGMMKPSKIPLVLSKWKH